MYAMWIITVGSFILYALLVFFLQNSPHKYKANKLEILQGRIMYCVEA